MVHAFSRRALAALIFSVSLASATPAAAINLFSVQQDAEVGRQAAQDAERQLPMLRDGTTENYVNAIVQRLAGVAPGPRFPYRARVVNTSDRIHLEPVCCGCHAQGGGASDTWRRFTASTPV